MDNHSCRRRTEFHPTAAPEKKPYNFSVRDHLAFLIVLPLRKTDQRFRYKKQGKISVDGVFTG